MEEIRLTSETHPTMDREISQSKREINISPLDYGYVIRVGCQVLAIESKQDIIRYLTDYLNNPNETENKYQQKQLLKHQ